MKKFLMLVLLVLSGCASTCSRSDAPAVSTPKACPTCESDD